ncbi:MAG: DUF3822 family protein [Bacteroidia bacterium]
MASNTLNISGIVEKLTEEKFPLKDRSIHTSIEIREKQLVVAILDKHSNQYICWASFLLEEKGNTLNNILEDEFLTQPSSSISIVFTPNSSILVPSPYFNKESVKDYLDTQLFNKTDETPLYDYIKNLDSYVLYTVNKTYAMLRNKYPNALFRHHSSIFLEYILIENKSTKEDTVLACVFTNYMDIAVLQRGKLVLSNRYYFENSSDFIYYLLWIYEQMILDVEKVQCIFYGEIEKASEIYKLSSRYIKNVTLGRRNEQSTYSIPLSSLSAHKYRSLFTQYLCV